LDPSRPTGILLSELKHACTHELAASSTCWFSSMGSKANNNATEMATKAKIYIFVTVVFMLPTITGESDILFISGRVNLTITRPLYTEL
jgi:hypothetical protein